jgi:hypothetical protein
VLGRGTYTLTQEEQLLVQALVDQLTIEGAGEAQTTISGDYLSRVFEVRVAR